MTRRGRGTLTREVLDASLTEDAALEQLEHFCARALAEDHLHAHTEDALLGVDHLFSEVCGAELPRFPNSEIMKIHAFSVNVDGFCMKIHDLL